MIFMGQMTQPTVSSTEEQQLVSPPGKGPIWPGQALYKVKWSKYNFLKNTYVAPWSPKIQRCLEDWELGAMRLKPDPVDQPERLCNVHCWNTTQYYSTETVKDIVDKCPVT